MIIGKHIGPYHFGRWPLPHVQQAPRSRDCVAACCAMLARTTIDDVYDWEWEPDEFGLFGWFNAVAWLAGRRITLGVRLCEGMGKSLDAAQCPVPLFADIKERHGILIVPSGSRAGWEHAIIWDACRKRVLDPLFSCPRRLRDYDRVIEWNPTTYHPYAYRAP